MEKEIDQFASEHENLLEQPLNPNPPQEVKEEEAEVEETPKNRQERRLRERLQAERESNIALNARLQAIAEAQKATQSGERAEYEKLLEQIYGNDTPEKVAATQLLTSSFKSLEKRAIETALAQFKEEQRLEREAIAESERKLDSFIEGIEDEYNVNMTPEMRRSYFSLLEKMSPKDSSGSITEYADPYAVWEVFQEKTQKRTDSASKNLASRSMTPSDSAGDQTPADDATKKLLRDAGII